MSQKSAKKIIKGKKEKLMENLEYNKDRKVRLVRNIEKIEREQDDYGLQFLDTFKWSLKRVEENIEILEKSIADFDKPEKASEKPKKNKKFSFSIKL